MTLRPFILTLGATLMTIVGCRPVELPEGPTSASPRFFAKANIGGVLLELAAGVDSVFMHTDAWVEGGSERRSGALAPLACPDRECGPALGFVFRKDGPTAPATGAEWQWVGPWYASAESVPATPQFQPVLRLDASASRTTGPAVLYRWIVNDEDLYVRTTPRLELPIPSGNQLLEISLETTDINGCQSTYTTRLSPQMTLADSVGLQVSLSQQPSGAWQLEAGWHPGTPPGNAFMWSNGLVGPFNIVLDEGVQCVHIEDTLAQVYASLCIEVLDIQSSDEPSFCLARFTSTPGIDTIWFDEVPFSDGVGLVEVWYVDDAGTLYSTTLGPQPDDAVLWISGAQPYLDNDQGMPTTEMSLTGKVVVYDALGHSRQVVLHSAHIAVARLE